MFIKNRMSIKKIIAWLHNSPLEISVNTKLRYATIVKKIKQIQKREGHVTILEVGSGSKGITRFLKQPVTGIDVVFQEHKNEHLKEVLIRPGQEYPFEDKTFDIVIAVDVVEHIPRKERGKALKEMRRISKRYVMITCPFALTRWDKRVLEKWPKQSATYQNIKEHADAGIPKPEEIESAFSQCRIEMEYGAPSSLSYFIKWTERNAIGKAFSRTVLKLFVPLLRLLKGTSRRVYFIEKPAYRA